MGNNIGTRTEDLCIYVQTNQPYYSPHTVVDGAVYLDVYRPVYAHRIALRIKGVERVKWEELKPAQAGGPPADAKNITEKVKDKIENFRLEVPLHQIGGTLAPGQYQFPFAFQLPEHLPGSCNIKHLDHEGRVRYALTAVLFDAHIKEAIKCRSELVVRQVPAIANYNAPVSSEQNVCVCCLSKGRCKLESCFQTDCYQPGQEAVLMCRADNSQCSVAIRNFHVNLLQHITFQTRHGKRSEYTRLVTRSSYPGIAAGSNNWDSPLTMSLKLEDPEAKGDPKKLALQPNVYGQLLVCRYDLEVRPEFDAPCSCCANVPTSVIPLHIYAPKIENWVAAIPPTFRPTVFEVNQIIIPLPGISISVPTMQANINMPTATMNVSGPRMDVTMPSVHANVSGTMTMNTGGATMRIDMPAPTMEVHTTSTHGDVTVTTNMEVPTMNAEFKF